jgi:hypothetical protein
MDTQVASHKEGHERHCEAQAKRISEQTEPEPGQVSTPADRLAGSGFLSEWGDGVVIH